MLVKAQRVLQIDEALFHKMTGPPRYTNVGIFLGGAVGATRDGSPLAPAVAEAVTAAVCFATRGSECAGPTAWRKVGDGGCGSRCVVQDVSGRVVFDAFGAVRPSRVSVCAFRGLPLLHERVTLHVTGAKRVNLCGCGENTCGPPVGPRQEELDLIRLAVP